MLEIVTHTPNAHELRRYGVRVAVVDDITDARKLAAVDELIEECKEALHGLSLSDLEQEEIDHVKWGLREVIAKAEGK